MADVFCVFHPLPILFELRFPGQLEFIRDIVFVIDFFVFYQSTPKKFRTGVQKTIGKGQTIAVLFKEVQIADGFLAVRMRAVGSFSKSFQNRPFPFKMMGNALPPGQNRLQPVRGIVIASIVQLGLAGTIKQRVLGSRRFNAHFCIKCN